MGVKLVGFEKLEAKLTKNMDLSKVKATVKKNGAQLQKTAQKNAPIDIRKFETKNCFGNYRWWENGRSRVNSRVWGVCRIGYKIYEGSTIFKACI